MRMIMFMTDENPFTSPTHAMLFVMFFQPFQAGEHRRVFFGLILFGAEGVIAEGV
jgi:hypothetical protein